MSEAHGASKHSNDNFLARSLRSPSGRSLQSEEIHHPTTPKSSRKHKLEITKPNNDLHSPQAPSPWGQFNEDFDLETFNRQEHLKNKKQILSTIQEQRNHVKSFLKEHDSHQEKIRFELLDSDDVKYKSTSELASSIRNIFRKNGWNNDTNFLHSSPQKIINVETNSPSIIRKSNFNHIGTDSLSSTQNSIQSSSLFNTNSIQSQEDIESFANTDFDALWGTYKSNVVNKKKSTLVKMSKALDQLNDYRKLLIESSVNKDKLFSLEKNNGYLEHKLSKLKSQIQTISYDEEQYRNKLLHWRQNASDKDRILVSTLKREENKVRQLRDSLFMNQQWEQRKWDYLDELLRLCMTQSANAEIIYQSFLSIEKIHNYYTNRFKEWKQYRHSKIEENLPKSELLSFINDASGIKNEEAYLRKHHMFNIFERMKKDIIGEMSKFLKLSSDRAAFDEYVKMVSEHREKLESKSDNNLQNKPLQFEMSIQVEFNNNNNSLEVMQMVDEILAKKEADNRTNLLLRLLENTKFIQTLDIDKETISCQTDQQHSTILHPERSNSKKDLSITHQIVRNASKKNLILNEANKQKNQKENTKIRPIKKNEIIVDSPNLISKSKESNLINRFEEKQTEEKQTEEKQTELKQIEEKVINESNFTQEIIKSKDIIPNTINQITNEIDNLIKEPSKIEIVKDIMDEYIQTNSVAFSEDIEHYEVIISNLRSQLNNMAIEIEELREKVKSNNVSNIIIQEPFSIKSKETKFKENISNEIINDSYLSQLALEYTKDQNEYSDEEAQSIEVVEQVYQDKQFEKDEEFKNLKENLNQIKENFVETIPEITQNVETKFETQIQFNPFHLDALKHKPEVSTKLIQVINSEFKFENKEKSVQTNVKGIPSDGKDNINKSSIINQKDMGPVGLVMIEIEKLSKIFEVDNELASYSLEIYNSIVNELLKTYEGTIVKQYYASGGYILAFTRVSNAVKFSLTLIKNLTNTAWPSSLMYMNSCRAIKDERNGMTIYRGPKVATSIITSSHSILGKDIVTRGDQSILESLRQLILMNNMARGGLIVVSNEVHKDTKINLLLDAALYISKPIKSNLRELQSQGPIRVLLPSKFQGRHKYMLDKKLKKKLAGVIKSKKSNTSDLQLKNKNQGDASHSNQDSSTNTKKEVHTLPKIDKNKKIPDFISMLMTNASSLLVQIQELSHIESKMNLIEKNAIQLQTSQASSETQILEECKKFLVHFVQNMKDSTNSSSYNSFYSPQERGFNFQAKHRSGFLTDNSSQSHSKHNSSNRSNSAEKYTSNNNSHENGRNESETFHSDQFLSDNVTNKANTSHSKIHHRRPSSAGVDPRKVRRLLV